MRTDKHKLNSSGIEIAPTRLIEPKQFAAADAALSLLLVLLGVFGSIWCFISAFSLPVLPLTVILYTLLFTGVLTLTFYLKRACYPIVFVLALLYGAALWYGRIPFVRGFIITTNRVMITYANHSDYVLPLYNVGAKPAQYPQFCTVFVLYAVFLIVSFVSWAVIRRKSFWLTFFATFPFLLASLIFTISPHFFAVLMLGACWTCLLFTRLSAGRKTDFSKNRNTYSIKSNRTASRSGLLMIPAILLCFALILAVFPQQSYQRSEQADRLKSTLTDTITQSPLLGGSNVLAGSVSHVDLSGKDEIRFTGKTMLKIKSDKRYPLYLKDFVGSVYTGSSWEQLADSEYTDINRKLNGLNVQNMSQAFFSLIGQQSNPNLKPFGIEVKNIAAAKQCIYAPYNLSTTPENITGVRFVNDAFIRSNSLLGTNGYTLYAYGFAPGGIYASPWRTFFTLAYNLLENNKVSYEELSYDEKAYLTSQHQYSTLNSNNIRAFYTDTIPDGVMSSLQGDKKKFMQSEQDYRLFMYDKYTQLPQGTKEKVQSLLNQNAVLKEFLEPNGEYSYSAVNQIANAVKTYLSKGYYYTLSPGRVPKGQNFAEYFLFESHKGYCVHFATAATVMLRAMGVPARYAEGYVVTQEDYKTAGADGWANIRDSRAHAWVEIYQPGLGWQPIEVTPGFQVDKNLTQDNNPVNEPPASSEAASSTPAESAPQSLPQSQASAPPQAGTVSSESAQSTGTRSGNDFSAAMIPVGFTLAAILLLLAAVALKRKIQLARRAKAFGLRNTNEAVLQVYAYLVRLTRYGGEISAQASGIALKARFSQHIITAQELKTITDFAQMLARQNYERLPKAKRFLFKYVDNLI
jgi:transglutaminase-like putative cysteine protease